MEDKLVGKIRRPNAFNYISIFVFVLLEKFMKFINIYLPSVTIC